MSKSVIGKYASLSDDAKHLLQLAAVQFEGMPRTELVSLSNAANWKDEQGRKLVYSRVQKDIRQLVADGMLVKSGRRVELCVNPELVDYVVQQAVHDQWFEQLAAIVEKNYPALRYGGYYGGDASPRQTRDRRIAFYRNQRAEIASVQLVAGENAIGVLKPFDSDIFEMLDPVLQRQYLVEAGAAAVADGQGDLDLADMIESLLDGGTKTAPEIVGCLIDIYAARGDLVGLRGLNKRLGAEFTEADGCAAFLQGDWEKAETLFDAATKRSRGKSRKKNIAIPHLSGLFHVMLLLRKNTPQDRKQARAMSDAIEQQWPALYRPTVQFLRTVLSRQENPTDRHLLFTGTFREAPAIGQLVAAYVSKWFVPTESPPVTAADLKAASRKYSRLGFDWLAAEIGAGLGCMSIKDASAFSRKSEELHQQLGTVSLLGLIEPEAMWQKCLKALSQLDSPAMGKSGSEATVAEERMIWELNYSVKYHTLELKPFMQKLSKKGAWTKGRPVALSRLYQPSNDPDEFAFLTDQDRQICRCIREDVSTSGWGRYTETYYYFDDDALAKQIGGHPLIFREGERTQPLEVVTQEPQLVVAKTASGAIEVSLDPSTSLDNDSKFCLREDGPHRLKIIPFSAEHLRLHEILGKKLKVPAAGEAMVLEAVRAVAPVISVHSEIGGAAEQTSESVAADARPHLHLTPFQDGLRGEFFIRPFGEAGPFYRPGEGGENVFAQVDNQPKSTRRDLAEECRRAGQTIAGCAALAARVADFAESGDTNDWQPKPQDLAELYFSSPIEALELILELKPLVDTGELVLHWPQGKKFTIAGHADTPQFRISVRKDRDWFAASGKLQVDSELSVDMMKLVSLVEASPSRFVKLDDGRFLALTEKLRRRVEQLSAYSERQKTKLRFPPIRAAALEDIEDAGKLKTDTHWKKYTQRIREASELVAEVPSTFQADLRDYQVDGYRWLCRLAHWGAGGCLADDMGLGKTIQALTLLLERSSGGPALVVAPTSVAFNWQNEAARFAPTLNVRLFGGGDRDAVFEDLGPRDVVICSYGLLHSEAERFQSQAWHTVVLDEAQAIKNMATKRSQAAMGLTADFRLIMTGTPLENHLGELWNLFQFINPGLLGSYEAFQNRFAVPIERDGCRDTRMWLKKLIQPFILRRTKSQVLQELPSRTEVTLQVELSTEEAALYEALRQRALEKLAEDDEPQHLKVLAELMRLRRACCHPRLVAPDCGVSGAKLNVFSETIDELLENRHKVLVFSQFVDHLSILRDELDRKNIAYQYLDGSTTAKQRKQRVEAFQAGQGDVFLISLKAGGLGLNLTAADYVIHMDPWWNPAVEDQASDRAHRLGQQRPVTIYRLITKGTIEERIVRLHQTKRDLADSLLEGTDISGKLSAEELLNLIRS